jgi:hypothetical protein
VVVELNVEQRYRVVLKVLEDGLPVTDVAMRPGVSWQIVQTRLRWYWSGMTRLPTRPEEVITLAWARSSARSRRCRAVSPECGRLIAGGNEEHPIANRHYHGNGFSSARATADGSARYPSLECVAYRVFGVVDRSEAPMNVVVDDPDVLHECIHTRRPHKAVSLRLQLPGERVRLRRRLR